MLISSEAGWIVKRKEQLLALRGLTVYTHSVSMDRKNSTRLSPEFVLLGFLYTNAGYGYELHRRLVSEFGYIWHISQSQTYNILKRLVEQGFISSVPVMQVKLPTRQLLQLSNAGKQRFVDWLNAPTNCSVHAIRVEFITRLYFSEQYFPRNTKGMIENQKDEVAQGLKRLRELQEDLPIEQRYNRLALDMRILLLSSIDVWLEQCFQEFAGKSGRGG